MDASLETQTIVCKFSDLRQSWGHVPKDILLHLILQVKWVDCARDVPRWIGGKREQTAGIWILHKWVHAQWNVLLVFVVSPDSEPTTEDSDLFVILQYKKPEAHTCAYALLTIEDVDGWASAFRERCCSADVSHDGGVRALGWHIKRDEYRKAAPTEHFHEIIMRRFSVMTILSVRQSHTSQHTITNKISRSLSLNRFLELPTEVFEELTVYLTIHNIWWLAHTIGIPACNVYITGGVVLRMIVGGTSEVHEMKLLVEFSHWKAVHTILKKEGFTVDPLTDQLPSYVDGYSMLYKKNKLIVWVRVYDTTESTPEGIIADEGVTGLMCSLTASGFVIPFSELTFANLTAVRPEAYDLDSEEYVGEMVERIEDIGVHPLVIGNRVISTCDLHRLRYLATKTLERQTTWEVDWAPK